MLKIVNKLPRHFKTSGSLEEVMPSVRKIIADVRKQGDKAVRMYAKRFDSVALKNLEISPHEIAAARKKIKGPVLKMLRTITGRLDSFARRQMAQFKNFAHEKYGVKLQHSVLPVQRAGIYVPGGRYPLASTAIMGVVPAKIAGVKEIIACTPNAHPLTLAAARIAGAHRIFRIGGAQAIAAMAIGTRSVPRVDVIAGPGNIYVTAAKKELYGETGIDFVAGPTELAIVADASAPVSFAAADILAQAEHDPQASILVITTSRAWADKLAAETKRQLAGLKTASTARNALRKSSVLMVKNMADAVSAVNETAPEHCQVFTKNPRKLAKKIVNCGTLLIGPYSSCALSDYSTGANHILPTALAGRYTGGLSVANFLKFITVQEVTSKGAARTIELASELAGMEGLEAHSRAALIRKKGL